jgi:hypothetical protein
MSYLKCPICFKGLYSEECKHTYRDLVSLIYSLEQEINILIATDVIAE